MFTLVYINIKIDKKNGDPQPVNTPRFIVGRSAIYFWPRPLFPAVLAKAQKMNGSVMDKIISSAAHPPTQSSTDQSEKGFIRPYTYIFIVCCKWLMQPEPHEQG